MRYRSGLASEKQKGLTRVPWVSSERTEKPSCVMATDSDVTAMFGMK